jgi:predicted N-formylglutamate amidohydrolase
MTSVLDKAVADRNLIVAENEAGAGPFVILCDHASNRIPAEYRSFGFATEALATRDPGALAILIAIHSFTPIYLGKARPWQVGIVFDEEACMANALIRGLTTDPALTVGVNEPYAPADLVYYTVSRHARQHGLLAAMIEIRNDEIADEAGQRAWADRLADILLAATPALLGAAAEHAVV